MPVQKLCLFCFFVAGFLFAFLGYDVFAHLFTDFARFAISWLCHYFSYFKLATAAPKNGITWNAYAHYYCCSFFIEMDCIKCREEKKKLFNAVCTLGRFFFILLGGISLCLNFKALQKLCQKEIILLKNPYQFFLHLKKYFKFFSPALCVINLLPGKEE